MYGIEKLQNVKFQTNEVSTLQALFGKGKNMIQNIDSAKMATE